MYRVKLNTPDGICLDCINSVFMIKKDSVKLKDVTGLLLYPDEGDTWAVITNVAMADRFINEMLTLGYCDMSHAGSINIDEEGNVDEDEVKWLSEYYSEPFEIVRGKASSLLDAAKQSITERIK